ncbi:hypothetical protein [Pedobacter sp. GR22-6]
MFNILLLPTVQEIFPCIPDEDRNGKAQSFAVTNSVSSAVAVAKIAVFR